MIITIKVGVEEPLDAEEITEVEVDNLQANLDALLGKLLTDSGINHVAHGVISILAE